MGTLSGIQIISLVGQQGAGKTVIGNALAKHYDGSYRVEASSVVREVCGNLPRAEMPTTNVRTATEPTWLGDAIARKIVDNSDATLVVLTGVREVEVHETIRRLGAELVVVKIYAPAGDRCLRLFHLKKCISVEEFEQHDKNEWDIGLGKVLSTASTTLHSSKYTSVTQLVDNLVDTLENGSSRWT